jgi:hypothetical protein
MPIKPIVRFATFVLLPAAILLPEPGTRAQVLNTRPLSQPNVNPSNPNAGFFGSRTNPGWRESGPGNDVNRRSDRPFQTVPVRRGTCWTDSLGQHHCQAGR